MLAVLAEFEPMGAAGPVTVEEVAHVLSERLRFLRPDPGERRWGRVLVGSIEEARGCEFRVVFLPGLAEGLFPRRALEDPLLLDHVRKELSRELPLRADRNHEERQKLRDDVPKQGLAAKIRGRTVFELATDTLKLARAGLKRRKHLDIGGRDETRYLEVLEDRLARGTTAAQELLEKYRGPWGGSVDPIYTEDAY